MDTGSSFLPSEITAAFLWAQLEHLDMIQRKRCALWQAYQHNLLEWAFEKRVKLPHFPAYATNNAHMFYMLCPDNEFRNRLIAHLRNNGIHAVFHYQSLHRSPYYRHLYTGKELKNADACTGHLLRLPLYYELTNEMLINICNAIKNSSHD